MAPTASSEAPGGPAFRRRWGQYFTPSWIARFLVRTLRALDPETVRPTVIDPACGEGAFLDAAAETLPESRLFGVDRDAALAEGWGERGARRLHVGDALTGPLPASWPGRFDWVVGNPPFGRWDADAGQRAAVLPLLRRAALARHANAGIPFELLFLERFLGLARPGGRVAVILPEGFAANGRYAALRAELFREVRLLAALTLPPDAFRRAGAAARTIALLIDAAPPGVADRTMVGALDAASATDRLAEALARREEAPGLVAVPQAEIAAGARLDAEHHRPAYREIEAWLAFRGATPLAARLAQRPGVRPITYGPINTGGKIPPSVGARGVPLIRGGEILPTGLDLRAALRVDPKGPWNPARSRVEPGDLLFPRSGEGSLGRGRLAVSTERRALAVGCFVNRIRFADPEEAVLAYWFLKSPIGWAQVRRRANGVGAPNINFSEIRELLLPEWDRRFRRELLGRFERLDRLHRRGLVYPAAMAEAHAVLAETAARILAKLAPARADRRRLMGLCLESGAARPEALAALELAV